MKMHLAKLVGPSAPLAALSCEVNIMPERPIDPPFSKALGLDPSLKVAPGLMQLGAGTGRES